MGEHHELTRPPRSRIGAAFGAAVGPERNAASVVYGIITVGAVLAAEGSHNEPYWRSIGAAVLIMILYWIVHAWSVDSGSRLEERRPFEWHAFRVELLDEFAIMRGGVVPILAVISAGLAGVTDQRAVFIGTLVSAAMIVLFEFAVAMRSRLAARQVIIQTTAGACFGVALIVLRYIVV